MNIRRFYIWHGLCGILLLFQLIFLKMWLPFHLLAVLFSIMTIFRYFRCRFLHLEFHYLLIALYILRVIIAIWYADIMFLWYLYAALLTCLGSILIWISLHLFF